MPIIEFTEKQRKALIGLSGTDVALALLINDVNGITVGCGSIFVWMLTERMRGRIGYAVHHRRQLRKELEAKTNDKELVDKIMKVGGWEE